MRDARGEICHSAAVRRRNSEMRRDDRPLRVGRAPEGACYFQGYGHDVGSDVYARAPAPWGAPWPAVALPAAAVACLL